MKKNTIDKIFELLSESDFKNPTSGLLFFPVYIYTYLPEDEFRMLEEIKDLDRKLQRPSNNLNCLLINVYEELINYLKGNEFAGKSYLEYAFEMEKEEDYEDAFDFIYDKANEPEFTEYLGNKFMTYFEGREKDKVYLFLYGLGDVYPYLRLSDLLKRTEKYTKNFKLIAFYPGEKKDNNYSLFSVLNDDNVYRASHLNEFI